MGRVKKAIEWVRKGEAFVLCHQFFQGIDEMFGTAKFRTRSIGFIFVMTAHKSHQRHHDKTDHREEKDKEHHNNVRTLCNSKFHIECFGKITEEGKHPKQHHSHHRNIFVQITV